MPDTSKLPQETEPLTSLGVSHGGASKNQRRKHWFAGPPASLIFLSLALLGCVLVFATWRSDPKKSQNHAALPVPEAPPSAPAPRIADAPPERPFVGDFSASGTDLPIVIGSPSIAGVKHSVMIEEKLPPAESVRIGELLNHFALRPDGSTAISQGVTVSAESVACPWKPSATLFIISFRGAMDAAHEVAAVFKPTPGKVARYRILGYHSTPGAPASGALAQTLPPKAIATLAIEVEPLGAVKDLGMIEWKVDAKPAASVTLTRRGDVEPSDDSRFATLVCAYGQWLAGEHRELIDSQLLAALARELASENLPPDRSEFLNLIDRSLNF